ncbi:hypothetical protein F8S13_02600 [Chloroflexia bacterium SDU3-3]|nr:hypothetical protein F8S13_02600 [Chloroflexia bacterium SDU3-3]
MHKATFFAGTLSFTIVPHGPILVKAGESSGADPTLPDMRFVRSQGKIYIPGPSLKGVVRAQAERICRSLDSELLQQQKQHVREEAFGKNEPLIPLADNPLGKGTEYQGLADISYSSGRAIEEIKRDSTTDYTATVYRRSSFVSQIFGHTSLAGRVRFADAYDKDFKMEYIEERNGVAIDRVYGSAIRGGLFNYEVVVGGSFRSQIHFENLTLAQLGLLGLALRDVADGRVGIGFGKSRGLGQVSVTFESMELRYPTCELQEQHLKLLNGQTICTEHEFAGLGAFCASEAYRSYALPKEDLAPLPEKIKYQNDMFLGVQLTALGDAQVRNMWRACMPAWKRELGL